jgi:PAS domain S-box-containing protein
MKGRLPCNMSAWSGTCVSFAWAAGVGLVGATRLHAQGAEGPAAMATEAWCAGLAGSGLVLGLGVAWWRERRVRRRLESGFKSANERLRVLFDESPLSICVFDPHDRAVPMRIVECNQHACDLHGYSREEMVGSGLQLISVGEVRYEDNQDFVAKLRQGTRRAEKRHRRKDGSVFFVEYVARLVVIDGREYVIGADRDLSAHKARLASEEELRRTAELNQLVLRASNDGIWDWRVAEGSITFSDRCREMLGYTAEELPDDSNQWLSLIHPEDMLSRAELLHRHWTEGVPYVYQFRARHKDGNWRWIVSRAFTLFDSERRPVRMVGCRTDITEMKRIDAELLQSRKLRAVGEMAGGIAHEFNNLLTPMLLYAEIIAAEHAQDARLISQIGPMRTGIERARELTQRILTFGRRPVDACDHHDLETVVKDNLAFLSRTIDRRIDIQHTVSPEPAWVWANRADLNLMVVNLMLNARDTLVEKAGSAAAPAGWAPRMEISVEAVTRASGAREERDVHTPRHWYRLRVRDNGLGISDEVRERVFEPFFTTKEVGQGTGLGLAGVWHVSTSLGGWTEIDSVPGEGSAFCVFLPAAETSGVVADKASVRR